MINKGLMSSNSNEWETPQWLFYELHGEFGFTLDPCCTKENAKCKRYYTKEYNGLTKDWGGECVVVNPPYGREISKWVKKCHDEFMRKDARVRIVMLIPARTDTKYFHEYIYNKARLEFIKGRLKFSDSKNSAPFPSMIVIFN